MKKLCLLLSLFVILLCTGCYVNRNDKPLETGIWHSESVSEVFDDGSDDVYPHTKESTLFSKAKYELKEITKEEYEEAKGENVFIDAYTLYKQEKRYMQVELHLMPLEEEEFILVNITNLQHKTSDDGYQYYGNIHIDLNNIKYDETIMMDFGFNRFTIYINNATYINFGEISNNK